MVQSYNSKRYHTPSVHTQLMDSREAHGKTQEALREMTIDRDKWKELAESWKKVAEENDNG